MSQPSTTLHYAPNANWNGNTFAPGADGFNLADVTSPSDLPFLPAGDKALVYLGPPKGVTAAFKAAVQSYIGSSQVYGFYLADVPAPSATTAAELKAESDWIHTHDPGVKTFMAQENMSVSPLTPKYYYTPANTHIDLFGVNGYPAQTGVPNHFDLNVINLCVKAAESIGIPQQDLVPDYQAFGGGGYAKWIVPTATQEKQMSIEMGISSAEPRFRLRLQLGHPTRRHRPQQRSGSSNGLRRSQRPSRRGVVHHGSGQWLRRGERIRQYYLTPRDRQQHGFQLGKLRV